MPFADVQFAEVQLEVYGNHAITSLLTSLNSSQTVIGNP